MNTSFSTGAEALKALPARLPRRKALEYGAMFLALGGIYYWYLLRDWQENSGQPEVQIVSVSQLAVIMLKFLAFTAWPFAIVAGFDSNWRSKDAGNVFLAVYVAANALFLLKTGCGFCVYAAVFRVIPYVLCAWLAHGIGARLNHLRRLD